MTKQCPRWWIPCSIVFAACAAPPPPAAVDDASPPWMLRHTFPGRDGKPVEVLGAPGPRAVAAFLSLAMRRAAVARPDDLGDVLRQIPSFYRFRVDQPDGGTTDATWHVVADVSFGRVEWEGNESQMFPDQRVRCCIDRLPLAEVAIAINDVAWKWPRLPGSRTFIRPPWSSPRSEGELFARLLREKLGRGMSLALAWQELQFQHNDELYVLTLLPNDCLRVSWHPELDPRDWPPPMPWVAKY